jgi:serine/threonine protein kinase
MCIQKTCDAHVSLYSAGISAQGCLRQSDWLKQLSIPSTQSIINPSIYVSTQTVKITCIKNVAHGSFGYIDIAWYETSIGKKEVYVKRPIIPGKSLLHEACMQKFVGAELHKIGFPTGAPKVLHIFRLRDDSICFAMEPIENAITLDRHLNHISTSMISDLLVECLLQLSAIVWHLNNIVGINHRDLKPSNFLIVEHSPITKVLQIENEIIQISSRYSLTMIDFGFSCLGSVKTHIVDLSLSTVYSKSDPCPKDGRDLFLFVGLLYIDYYNRLPPTLLQLFESWLGDSKLNTTSKLCHLMRKDGENAKKWIYFIAGNESIHTLYSYPLLILHDLESLRTI